jgi:hypothetical protein
VTGGVREWRLERFADAIEAWIERESPSDEMRLRVVDWVWQRQDDPYRGMRRDDLPNLWFGPIPGTQVRGTVVTCSYWIYEANRTVLCSDICTLNQLI